MIVLHNLHRAFGSEAVLRGLSLTISKNEIFFIIGASGAGKSVAIKQIVGLLRPDRGEIFLDGQPIHTLRERALYPIRKRCGMVFQHATLFDSLTVLQNVALPLRKHYGLRDRDARLAAKKQLAVLDLAAFADAFPGNLGMGHRKGVAIARALTLNPEYLLFDEPTTGLDPCAARRIDRLIVTLKTLGVTAVVVSHDLVSTFAIADRVAFLYQGRAHFLGTPAELRASTDPIVQQFIRGESEGPMETPGF